MPKHGHGEGKAFGLGALSAGAVLSAIAGAYKFGEFLVHLRKLHDVGEENAVFVRMVERVRLDLQETERLLAVPEIKHALSRSPEKTAWIKQVVTRMRIALEEKAKWTESVRKGIEGGRILGLKKRIWWVLEEHEKLVNRRMELAMCHLGLLQVISFLEPLEPLACCQPEGMYKANERYFKEADEMIRRHDIPEQEVQVEEDRYRERRYEEMSGALPPRARELRKEEREYLEENDNVREYETAGGDIVVEDRREFRSAENDSNSRRDEYREPHGGEVYREKLVYKRTVEEEEPEHHSKHGRSRL